MKNIHYLLVLLLFTGILNSCKKEIVEIPESNNPIFTISGTIGNDSINYFIGDDISSFSTYIEKYNGVDFFAAKFIHEASEIELGFYRGDNDFENLNIDSILQLENIHIAKFGSGAIFEMKKSQFSNYANIKEIKWYIDGVYSGTNYIKITDPGKYNVCASITYMGAQESIELCNEIIVGFRRNTNFKLNYSITPDNHLSSWIETSETSVSQINWFLNDVSISSNSQLEVNVPDQLSLLRAEITFANGTKRTRSIVVDGTGNNKSIEDFAYYENLSNMAWDYQLKLNIKHNGDEFTSLFVDNEANFLSITGIEFMGFDPNDKPVYIFKGVLNSKVQSKASNQILDVKLNVSWGLIIE